MNGCERCGKMTPLVLRGEKHSKYTLVCCNCNNSLDNSKEDHKG